MAKMGNTPGSDPACVNNLRVEQYRNGRRRIELGKSFDQLFKITVELSAFPLGPGVRRGADLNAVIEFLQFKPHQTD